MSMYLNKKEERKKTHQTKNSLKKHGETLLTSENRFQGKIDLIDFIL